MPSLFRDASSTDFDDLFDPYVQGSIPGNTGSRTSDGTDLAGRYAPLAFGTKRADVNVRNSAGIDLSNLWAAKGTASYSLAFNAHGYNDHNQALTNATGTTTAMLTLTIANDGTWRITSRTGAVLESGTWLPAGKAVTDYDVQFSASGAATASIGNNAPSYANCGTSRAISASVSVPARSTDFVSESITITCLLRSNTGAVSTTVCSFVVSAQGWL
jgi:hypothetical protein